MNTELLAATDIEKTVLGACLQDSEALHVARLTLRPADLSLDGHRRIYAAACKLDDLNRGVDIITVSQALEDSQEISAAGGWAYIADLTSLLPRHIAVGDYVSVLKEKARLRALGTVLQRSLDMLTGADSSQVVSGLQDGLQAILDDTDADNPHVSAYSVSELDSYERERRGGRSVGLPFGLGRLDAMTGGLRDGEVCIVGARPGIGKTSLACQAIANNCAAGRACHFFSLEMTRGQILRRLWSIVSGVAYKRIKDGWLSSGDDAARVQAAAGIVTEWPLRIHDKSEMHLSQIVANARLSIQRHNSRLIVVDYAQNVNSDAKDMRHAVIQTATALTSMIKHERASLMLLSQLAKGNRDSYSRRPVLADLLESGKLEQVAHLAILLHREWDEEQGRTGEAAELNVAKQRGGDTGIIEARFNRKTVIFEEAA
jgi:replicative DNA helicase